MTTTANSSANNVGTNPVSTTTIASSFARKYYSILSKEPHNLFHFYKENSVFIRGNEETEGEENTFGKENINKKIQSLQYHDCKVSVSALEAQPSVDNGILLTAVGLLSNKGEPPKRFVQTFFLAPQTDPVGYYVRNDILFYLKDQPNAGRQVTEEKPKETSTEKQHQAAAQPAIVQPAQEPKQAHAEAPKQATPASPTPAVATPTVVVPPTVVQLSPVVVHSAVASTATQPTAQQSQPQAQKESQKESQKEEPKKAEKPIQDKKQPQEKKQDGEQATQQAHDKKPKQEGKQKQPKAQPPQPQQPQQPAQPAKPAVATWASVAASQNQQPAPPPDVILKQQQEQLTQKSEEDKQKDPENLPIATSVYVTNLPYSATEQQVRTQFSTLGEVKNIVMRKGFCFIEFSTREVMKAVIDKAAKEPLVMDGRTLNVEQKKKGGNKGKSDKKDNKGPKENKEGKEGKEGKPRKSQQPQQNNHDSPRNDTKREKPQANNVNSKQPSEKNANHQPKPKATAPPKQ